MLDLVLLVAVQLGSDHFQLFTEFRPVLTAVVKDHTVTMEERSAVSVCVCVCVVLCVCVCVCVCE